MCKQEVLIASTGPEYSEVAWANKKMNRKTSQKAYTVQKWIEPEGGEALR